MSEGLTRPLTSATVSHRSKYLRVASLGYASVAADVLYLWSIQYYSNFQIEDRYKYVDHIYSGVITELDPHYFDPYWIGAMILSVDCVATMSDTEGADEDKETVHVDFSALLVKQANGGWLFASIRSEGEGNVRTPHSHLARLAYSAG